MKSDKPSRTAAFVTLGRAMADAGVSHLKEFRDPTARHFLDEKAQRALAKTEAAVKAGAKGFRLEYARAMGDMMGLRTIAIDTAVREALARGAKQLVILGAGFDGRAWRMPELTGIRIFEVDHPATQGAKRARIAGLPDSKGPVTFVAGNFESESISQMLQRAGHDPKVATCWIWEGVVMYLTKEAMRATLKGIAKESAPGSTLILNYHSASRRFIASLIFRLIGEPMISAWSPAEMKVDLEAAGFTVREDTGLLDWNARWANGAGNVARATHMRIVVAERR